jgi:two-component system sensor histidine kinase UhpB
MNAVRILLLEDSAADAHLIVRALRDADFDCITCCVQTEAGLLQELTAFGPEVLLSDYAMPGFDGSAALEFVRHHTPDLPFIFVSGMIGEERAIDLLRAGATDFVLKSNLARLPGAISRALRESSERSARARAEAELRGTQTLLQHAMAVSSVGTWVAGLGNDTSIVWSEETRRILGVCAEASRGSRADFLSLVHIEDKPAMQRLFEETEESGLVHELDHRIMHSDGTVRWIRERAQVQRHGEDGEARLYGVLQDITEQRHNDQERTRANDKLRLLSHALLRVQERERAALSRELHDEIGQTFTALKIHLQAAQRMAHTGSTAAQLDECMRIVEYALERVRGLSIDLRPPQLDHFGLVTALRSHLLRVPRPEGLELRLESNTESTRVDSDVEIACFRIVQEAITNVLRHANATQALVDVEFRTDEVLIQVRDDGCGFEPEAASERISRGQRLGLLGMQERASLLGGRLQIASMDNGGTQIVARFPLPPERRHRPRAASS